MALSQRYCVYLGFDDMHGFPVILVHVTLFQNVRYDFEDSAWAGSILRFVKFWRDAPYTHKLGPRNGSGNAAGAVRRTAVSCVVNYKGME